MKKFAEIRDILLAKKEDISKRFGVKQIGIFGSYVRGEEGKDSDIDVLVKFEKDKKTLITTWT